LLIEAAMNQAPVSIAIELMFGFIPERLDGTKND
jgi:hypothetical protein